MNKVVDFAQAKLEREAHCFGPAFCSHCHHEWTAVAPVGTIFLECPECHTWKGLMKGPTEPEHEHFVCNCGCYVFEISGATNIICINCGVIHGQQFFPDPG